MLMMVPMLKTVILTFSLGKDSSEFAFQTDVLNKKPTTLSKIVLVKFTKKEQGLSKDSLAHIWVSERKGNQVSKPYLYKY